MAGHRETGSAPSKSSDLTGGELYRIVRWSRGHPLQSSVGVLAAIVVVVGAVVGFSRFNDFVIVFGATLLAVGLVWALFTATKENATWEKKVAVTVIILCMVFGGGLIVWPKPVVPPPHPIPSRVQYSLEVLTQRPVSNIGGNDNVSTMPDSRSTVEARLGGSCKKHLRLNERGDLMAAGVWVRSTFETSVNCRFTSLTLVLQQDHNGEYDDWAFERIRILDGEEIIVNEVGQWAIGDSRSTNRTLQNTIFLNWRE